MPRLSFANLMVPECTPAEQIEAAAAAGYDSVGLCIFPPERLGAEIVRNPVSRRAVKRQLARHNMTVLDVEVFPLLPDFQLSVTVPALETAAELGAEFVLVTGNDTDEDRVCDSYAALCDAALPLGLRPTLEFISYRPLRDIHQADRWLRRVNRPNAGICVDALHLFRSGGTLDDLRSIEPAEIGYAQICDAASLQPSGFFSEEQLVRESRTDRRLPGEGVLPLVEFLAALPPGLAISVEAPCEAYAALTPAARAGQALRTTRSILER